MTPERADKIRACWSRIREAAAHDGFPRRAVMYRAILEPMELAGPPATNAAVTESTLQMDTVTFVHEVEHLPGTSWRIVCEGVVLEQGPLQDNLSRLLRGETFLSPTAGNA